MSEVLAPSASPITPGPLSAQGQAIAARLQLVFPPSRFQFKYLPGNIGNASVWRELTQGTQPFLGLGFVNMTGESQGETIVGIANWILIAVVRAAGKPATRFYGDAQGIGVFDMATCAAAVLNGAICGTGSVVVKRIANMIAEDDAAVMQIDLSIQIRLALGDLITNPGENLFEAMTSQWNSLLPAGGVDIYSSDWENPNVPA